MWKQYSDKSKLPGEVIIEANKEEMPRSILIFYKKALYDKEKLLKDLTVGNSSSIKMASSVTQINLFFNVLTSSLPFFIFLILPQSIAVLR